MIVNWADAYAREENKNRERREELITAIAVVAGRMEANMALTRSGYQPAGRGAAGCTSLPCSIRATRRPTPRP